MLSSLLAAEAVDRRPRRPYHVGNRNEDPAVTTILFAAPALWPDFREELPAALAEAGIDSRNRAAPPGKCRDDFPAERGIVVPYPVLAERRLDPDIVDTRVDLQYLHGTSFSTVALKRMRGGLLA